MVGGCQYEDIINRSQKYRIDKKNKRNFIDNYNALEFPLIFEELKQHFSSKLKRERHKDDYKHMHNKIKTYEKETGKSIEDAILIKRCTNGKTALAYYEGGEIQLATYISIGTSENKTISNRVYKAKIDKKYRRSSKYNNAPMPYSIHIT